jgi:hypothetical protein
VSKLPEISQPHIKNSASASGGGLTAGMLDSLNKINASRGPRGYEEIEANINVKVSKMQKERLNGRNKIPPRKP